MDMKQTRFRLAIRRNHAGQYILSSLLAFAVTVIVTRAFLQLTRFPQIGNSVLHIAHALWGGLLLIIASYLPLAYAGRLFPARPICRPSQFTYHVMINYKL